MRVIVTGGAGFIGSNLVWALLAAGHEVGVIDNLSTGKAGNRDPRSDFVRMDILDEGLGAWVAGFKPEAVVHLAAQPSVSRSIAEPDFDRRVNVDGTRAVASAAAAAGARLVLSASSAAVYGEPESVPLAEDARKSPAVPYGHSKLEAEDVLAEVLASAGVDFAALRFSNVYGPRQDAAGEGGVIAIFSDRIVAGQMPTVYGDGSQTRDFIYVGDVVGAIMSALEADVRLAEGGGDGPAYNISTGAETSVVELAARMLALAEADPAIEFAPVREGDVDRSALDPGKAERVFGWRASADMDGALGQTLRWFALQAAREGSAEA